MNIKILVAVGFMAGCAGALMIPYEGTEPEPTLQETLVKKGNSYACSTKQVDVMNPLDADIVMEVDCRCGTNSPTDLTVPAHKIARVYLKSDSGYDAQHSCHMDWNFKQ